jgi:hypothetical protein
VQIRFGLAVDGRISEGFGAFLSYTNQTNQGKLSFEGETTLSNHIITLGPRYNYKRFFVKGGLSYIIFQEKNDAYTFNDSLLGYYIGAGARLTLKKDPLNFIRELQAMLEIGYTGGVYQPEEEGIKEVDFSGISANAGIYIKF